MTANSGIDFCGSGEIGEYPIHQSLIDDLPVKDSQTYQGDR